MQAVGLLGLVLAVVIGLVVWPSMHKAPALNRAPFYLALGNLAAEPAVHYSGSLPGGAASWDLEATSGGEQIGTVTVSGQQISVLSVGGKTYFKPPQDMLANLPAGVPSSAVQDKWITGDDALTSALPQGLGAPADLASTLGAALAKTSAFPHVGAPTVRIGSVPALQVSTPSGVLYTSATAPYRVLRLASAATDDSSPSLLSDLRQGPYNHPITQAAWSRAKSSTSLDALGQTDLTAMTPSDVDRMYGSLEDQTKTLTGAVDLGISFNINGQLALSCSDAGCDVTGNVTSTTTSRSAARLSGAVTASMTATVTVNGMAAGSCTGQGTLPINGTGTITCPDPETAGIVAEIKAEKQQEADAEAAASPGQRVEVPYTLDYAATGEVWAEADVQAEVDQEVTAEQAEQNSADQAEKDGASCPIGTQNSFVAGTRVLMADGTLEPIQGVKVGEEIDNANPGSGTVEKHVVTAVHITDTDRDFVDLTIATSGSAGRGDLNSTAHHLFYDTTTAAWTDAADLKPGNRLQTPGHGVATVVTVRAYTAVTRTYNLTIDGVHTYYVEAGGTPVLVHNANPCNLTKNGRKVLGNLGNLKDVPLRDAIKSRGGGAGQVNQVATYLQDLPVGEVANLAATKDADAITAMKLLKQAASKAQKYGGK